MMTSYASTTMCYRYRMYVRWIVTDLALLLSTCAVRKVHDYECCHRDVMTFIIVIVVFFRDAPGDGWQFANRGITRALGIMAFGKCVLLAHISSFSGVSSVFVVCSGMVMCLFPNSQVALSARCSKHCVHTSFTWGGTCCSVFNLFSYLFDVVLCSADF